MIFIHLAVYSQKLAKRGWWHECIKCDYVFDLALYFFVNPIYLIVMNDPKTFIEPVIGFVADILAKIRNRPFVPHSLMKLQNLKVSRDMTGAKTIVEIGSFKGITTRRLSYLFDRVISVEIDPVLHGIAQQRCGGRTNIELLLGDGSQLLGGIAGNIEKAVLYLDGHYSGGQTGMGDEPEPVLRELDLVADNLDRFSAVIVDDFRLFGVEQGWPSKADVMLKLETLLPSPVWKHYVMNDQYVSMRHGGKF